MISVALRTTYSAIIAYLSLAFLALNIVIGFFHSNIRLVLASAYVRGSEAANENDLSMMIATGLVVLIITSASYLRHVISNRSTLIKLSVLFILSAFGSFCLYVLMLLASRGVTIALLTALAAFACSNREGRLPVLIVLLTAISSLIIFPNATKAAARFGRGDVSTLNKRLPTWMGCLNELDARSLPFLIRGAGPGNSRNVVARTDTWNNANTHNAYLLVLLDYGLVGLLLFMALLFVAYLYAGPVGKSLVILLAVCSLSASLVDQHYIWSVLGIALACREGELNEGTP